MEKESKADLVPRRVLGAGFSGEDGGGARHFGCATGGGARRREAEAADGGGAVQGGGADGGRWRRWVRWRRVGRRGSGEKQAHGNDDVDGRRGVGRSRDSRTRRPGGGSRAVG